MGKRDFLHSPCPELAANLTQCVTEGVNGMEELLQIMKNTMDDYDNQFISVDLPTEARLWIEHLEGLVNEDA